MKFKLTNLLSPAFICLVISLIFTILGTIFYQLTFETFRYSTDRSLLSASIISIWFILVLLVTGLTDNKKPFWVGALFVVIPTLLVFSLIRLLTPNLNAIGVFFSPAGVGMGDVATNSVGVPRCITGAVFYLVSAIAVLVGSFFDVKSIVKEGGNEND